MPDNKRALITGAARGIGLGIAELLLERGWSVMMLDIDPVVEKVAAELGGQARSVVADVSSAKEVESAVAATVEQFGGLDTIVNNAAIDYFGTFMNHDDDEFAKLIAVNLTGVYHGIKYGGRAIVASGGGAVINIASIAGMGGVPHHAAYNAAKAAVINMSQSAALDFPFTVRVNAVCPGAIDTPMLSEAGPGFKQGRGMSIDEFAKQSQGRLGTVRDVAYLVAFLASEEATFINGALLPIDGGATAKAF
jgi:NAD(P)-dependent dehydrogenase (short-subunit alcohol dehydrogenase family)